MTLNMFGLERKTLHAITECFKQFPAITWVKVYGSRAKGNYRPGSDIDLAFSSPTDCSAQLLAALDELPTPYLFDVTHFESLQHQGLREHIERVGVVLYEGVGSSP